MISANDYVRHTINPNLLQLTSGVLHHRSVLYHMHIAPYHLHWSSWVLRIFLGWKPSITVRQILIGIQDLLDNPNPASPAQNSCYELLVKVSNNLGWIFLNLDKIMHLPLCSFFLSVVICRICQSTRIVFVSRPSGILCMCSSEQLSATKMVANNQAFVLPEWIGTCNACAYYSL